MLIDWERTKVALGLVGRVRCEENWRLGPEWSERLSDYDLWLVWAGEGRMRLTSGTIALRPGICLWMRPGGTYLGEHDPSDPLGVTFAHFRLEGAASAIEDAARLPPVVHHVDVVFVDAVLRRVVDLMHAFQSGAPGGNVSSDALVAAQLVRAILMDLDAATERDFARPDTGTSARHRAKALEAAARIRENPTKNWQVPDLAKEAGYCSDHFSRIFRDSLGCAPLEFVMRSRIERAKHMLLESSLTIGQIADALGYSSPHYFSRQIRQRTGLTPSQLRANPQAWRAG